MVSQTQLVQYSVQLRFRLDKVLCQFTTRRRKTLITSNIIMSKNTTISKKTIPVTLLACLTFSAVAHSNSDLDPVTQNIIWNLCKSPTFRQCVASNVLQNEIDNVRSCRLFFDNKSGESTRIDVLKLCINE